MDFIIKSSLSINILSKYWRRRQLDRYRLARTLCLFVIRQNGTTDERNFKVFKETSHVLGLFGYATVYMQHSGFGGLGVVCWPLVPKFAGSNPAEAVGFFSAKKSSARLPS